MKPRAILASVILTLAVLAPVLAGPQAAAAAPDAGPGCAEFYTVRRGDNLYRIALHNNTTVDALAKLNGLKDPSKIYVGQRLCLEPAQPSGFNYTVNRGDTLSAIGRRYGWSASYLAQVNNLADANKIRVGQVLFIPNH
jgi:LysM repeat protein